MQKLITQSPRSCPVAFGNVTFYLTSYQISGIRTIAEAAAASGKTTITENRQKGTRITLKGKLSPDIPVSDAAAALAASLHSGTEQNVVLEGLRIPSAVLCQYAVSAVSAGTDVMMILYTAEVLIKEETT